MAKRKGRVIKAVKKTGFYPWYFSLATIYSSFTVIFILAIALMPSLLNSISLFWGPISIIWFFFNVAIPGIIIVGRKERKLLWFPGLYIFDYLFTQLMTGVILISTSMTDQEIVTNPLFVCLSIAIPVITLVLARIWKKK